MYWVIIPRLLGVLWITSDMKGGKPYEMFFIFYELHKNHKGDVGVTLEITFWESIVSPCIRQIYCSGVISATSSLVLGH